MAGVGLIQIWRVAVVVDEHPLAAQGNRARDPLAEAEADLLHPVRQAVPDLREEGLFVLIPQIHDAGRAPQQFAHMLVDERQQPREV
jgi:hypothetical protein